MRRLLACAVVTLALVAQQHVLRGDHRLNSQMNPKEPRAARVAKPPTDRDQAFLDAVEGLRQPGDGSALSGDLESRFAPAVNHGLDLLRLPQV